MDPVIIGAIFAFVLGGSLWTAVAVFRKAGREAESIAAQTLIAVNDELRKELARRDEEINRLRERIAVLESKVNGHGP